MRISRHTALLLLGLSVGTCVIAAPAVKPKAEPVPAATAEHHEKSQKNLKELALAWHNYHDLNGKLPTNQVDAKGKMLLSWRVQILQLLDQEETLLYKKFKLDEPWDSDHNKKLIDKMPAIYKPIRVKAGDGLTFYQSFTGKHGILQPGKNWTFANIPDGTSNTFMIAEAGKPVIWTKPDDMVFDGKDLPELGGLFDGKFNVAMGDGSVQRIKKGADADTLRKLIDPADGNVINIDVVVDDEK